MHISFLTFLHTQRAVPVVGASSPVLIAPWLPLWPLAARRALAGRLEPVAGVLRRKSGPLAGCRRRALLSRPTDLVVPLAEGREQAGWGVGTGDFLVARSFQGPTELNQYLPCFPEWVHSFAYCLYRPLPNHRAELEVPVAIL